MFQTISPDNRIPYPNSHQTLLGGPAQRYPILRQVCAAKGRMGGLPL